MAEQHRIASQQRLKRAFTRSASHKSLSATVAIAALLTTTWTALTAASGPVWAAGAGGAAFGDTGEGGNGGGGVPGVGVVNAQPGGDGINGGTGGAAGAVGASNVTSVTANVAGGDGGLGTPTGGGGGGGTGAIVTAPNLTITNNFQISAGNGGGLITQTGGGGGGADALVFVQDGTLINTASGAIHGGNGGGGGDGVGGGGGNGVVFLGNGDLTNSGTIIAGNGGPGTTFGAGRGGNAVIFSGNGTLTNFGTITGGNNDAGTTVGKGGVVFLAGGTLTNSGMITGGNSDTQVGGIGVAISQAGTVTNFETIRGGVGLEGGGGVTLYQGGALTNSGAIIGGDGISGASLGFGGNAGVAVFAANTGTINNSGTIQGGTGGAGVAGFGSGSGGAGAIALALGNGGTINNTGTIQGGAGGANASGGSAAAGGDGILASSGGTITNSGNIIGGTAGSAAVGASGIRGANLSVIDSGTISRGLGGSASANAISFAAGSNSLELQRGWLIVGNVVGAAGSTNTLILGGDATDLTSPTGKTIFDVSQIAPVGSTTGQYQGFTAFQKTGLSTWQLIGSTTAATPWMILAGTLQTAVADVLGANSAVTVASAGTLDLNGFNQTTLSLTNAGLVNMGTGTPPTTVLSTGNYVGQGGTIAMNTFLGDDTSPSDRLVIDSGTATGNTFLHFTNASGPGALTTANGILVVDTINGATTAADAFTLANPELRAGFYDYHLFRGPLQLCQPNMENNNVCESWYLRSTFSEEPVTPPVTPPEVTPPEVLPPTPPTPGPGLFPIIGPEIATYGVVQPMAQQLGRSMLGTHDERLGDLYPVPCEPTAPIYTKAPPLYTKAPATDCGTDGFRPAVWGRLFGQQIDNHYQAYADPRTDGQIAGMQVGFDVVRSDSLIPGHKDYGGLYFAYGNANVDVSGLVTNAAATAYVLQHTGSLNLNAYSGGAYWTHYGVPGWYVDLVLQGTSYNGGASTEFAALKTTGSGFISSIEGGYPIALPLLGPGFVLEPQAQILWQWIGFDAGNDGLGPVALGTTSETTARVGLKGKWTITTDSGQVWQPYVRTNVWSDFGGTATTMFGVGSVPLISHAQYMDVDAGFTTKINTHLSAFAEAGYQFAVSNDGGGQRNGVKGTAGLRYQW